jgi:hypothetical protein
MQLGSDTARARRRAYLIGLLGIKSAPYICGNAECRMSRRYPLKNAQRARVRREPLGRPAGVRGVRCTRIQECVVVIAGDVRGQCQCQATSSQQPEQRQQGWQGPVPSRYRAMRLGLLLWGQLPGEHQPGPPAPAHPRPQPELPSSVADVSVLDPDLDPVIR